MALLAEMKTVENILRMHEARLSKEKNNVEDLTARLNKLFKLIIENDDEDKRKVLLVRVNTASRDLSDARQLIKLLVDQIEQLNNNLVDLYVGWR
jgi:hypothetical protein